MSRLGVLAVLLVPLLLVAPAQGVPLIEITEVPPYGSLGYLHGQVTGVDQPENYRVATYIQPEGVGWWTKPYSNSTLRTVPVDPNGSFEVNVTTGGPGSSDPQTTLYCVNLLEAGEVPELAAGLCYQPESPLLFLATDTHERYGTTINFAGYQWGVKESPLGVSPGPNLFSDDPADVSVEAGKLHLGIHQNDSKWYSTEVILTESLGHGRYTFHTSSHVDELDSSAIFGAFLWDAFGEPGLPEGRCNREVDFEDGVWPDPPPGNTQFVVQPWNEPGTTLPDLDNLHRFDLPDLSADARLTRILTWQEGQLHFLLLRGHHGFDDYTPLDIIEEWTYLHDPDEGQLVPDTGRERFRFNLWLRSGIPPAGDGILDVVVDYFDFLALGDFDDDGDVDADDIDLLGDAIRLGLTDAMYDLSGVGEDGMPDTVIDRNDMDYLIHQLVETTVGVGSEYGDFNLDGKIDNTDLTRLTTNYGPDHWGWDDGNANRYIDTNIDNTDLTILATYYGFGEPDAIPEPMTLSLLALGGLALLRRMRK